MAALRRGRNPAGRRGKPAGSRLTVIVKTRLTTAEFDELCRVSRAAGVTLSEYIRARTTGRDPRELVA